MADHAIGDDPAFADLDERIELIDARIERCGRAIQVSRLAVWLGCGTLVATLTVLGSWRTPPIVFGALTAALGGLIWLGASRSSRIDLEAERVQLEAERTKLFDAVAIRKGWADLTPTIH